MTLPAATVAFRPAARAPLAAARWPVAALCALAVVACGASALADDGRQREPVERAIEAATAEPSAPVTEVSAAEARRILAPPREGSISWGWTNGGRVDRAAKLPPSGQHWAFFPHIEARGMTYGTDEMAGFLDRISGYVARRYKGSKMFIGNVSPQTGGASQWHRSHQSGRDVDIAYYLIRDYRSYKRARARAKRRKREVRRLDQVPLDNFVKITRRMKARDRSLGAMFDVRRNTALVKAMVTDTVTPVQWIFCAPWVEKAVLRQAERFGYDAAVIARMEEVMHRPSRAAIHDDHMHVRFFCSVQDRLHGCLDREPWRAWVDRGDDAYDARVQQLIGVMARPEPAFRRKAIAALEEIRAVGAVPALAASIADADPAVRRRALRALRVIGTPSAAPLLVEHLREVRDSVLAGEVFETVERLDEEVAASCARDVVEHPDAILSGDLCEDTADLAPLHQRAAKALRSLPARVAVPPLLALLDSPSGEVRLAADRALSWLTNQRGQKALGSDDEAERAEAAKAWRGFWDAHHDEDWTLWLAAGFEDAGYRLRGGRKHRRSDVRTLLRALRDKRPHVAHNAARMLSHVTGHTPRAKLRSRRRTERYWRRYYRRHRRKL